MALVMGSRSAFGLFVSPLNSATGIGLAGLAFAIAVGQLAQGVAQPALGVLADRYGAQRLIRYGALVLAPTTLAVTMADSLLAMSAAMAVMAFASSAVGSSNLLVAEVGRRVPLERRAMAFGLVSAGGSAGQMLFGPATQALIEMHGWVFALGATAWLVCSRGRWRAVSDRNAVTAPAHEPVTTQGGRDALRSPAFWLIAGSYAVCGFHVGYLTTHMPGVIERCGLPASLAGIWLAVLGVANIAGSLSVVWWLRRTSSHAVLMGIFGLRGASVALLLALPPSPAADARVCGADGPDLHGVAPRDLATGCRTLRHRSLWRPCSASSRWYTRSAASAVSGWAVWWPRPRGATRWSWSIDIGLALTAIALQWRLVWAPSTQRATLRLRTA